MKRRYKAGDLVLVKDKPGLYRVVRRFTNTYDQYILELVTEGPIVRVESQLELYERVAENGIE